MGNRRGACVRCGRPDMGIKARRLCESCWMQANANGTLEKWPTVRRYKSGVNAVGYCQCFNPIREELPLWGTAQCRKCGKKVNA